MDLKETLQIVKSTFCIPYFTDEIIKPVEL